MKTGDFGIAAGSGVDRLLKTLRFERTGRVPNWELGIEARTVERLVGKKLKSQALPVPDMVELALQTGMDAIFSPTPRGSGDVRGLGERWRREEDGSETYRSFCSKSPRGSVRVASRKAGEGCGIA